MATSAAPGPGLRRVGILTGGGDVPGLNVAIKAAVLRAQDHGMEVVGLRRGWASVMNIDPDDRSSIERWTVALPPLAVRTIDRTGGTILHSSRTNPCRVAAKDVPAWVRDADRRPCEDASIDCTAHAVRVIDTLGLDALIPIGGEDTLGFAERLHRQGVPVMAVPKTMDNDVFGTDYCIGFSTAVSRSVELIADFRSALGSHERIGVVELFGRESGGTSLHAAYLADADRALIPEVPFDIERLAALLQEDRSRCPSGYAIVTISEGALPAGGEVSESGEADAFGHRKLGGIGAAVGAELKKRTGVNMMLQQLGYVIRSGQPDTVDRLVATSFGTLAVDEVAKGRSGRLVGLRKGVYTTESLEVVARGQRRVDVEALYDAEVYRPRVREVAGQPVYLQ